ncbi:MAG: HAD-IC family P-type ATPase [Candidatus ainarchaeum sp.]|nr:HAD-IC family P-type ATPase [Candidatus ainarchaeum sp.]
MSYNKQSKFYGLKESQALILLNKYGENKIEIKKKFIILKMFLRQFTSLLIVILLISSIIFFIIGEKLDAFVIFAIVLINSIIGFIQEYKAEKAVSSLKKMLTKIAIVIRDGKEKEINVEKLVPGDVVILSEGDKVPADIKLFESFSLKVDESILTGESVSVSKNLKSNKEVICFSGTTIVSGKAKGVVISTGINTEFGKIINLVSETNIEKSLFEKQLDSLSRKIVYILIFLIIILFVIGLFRGIGIIDNFLITVSLAIAAIPEGLPIVITLTLALGVQVMSKQNAIVRKMSAIESLGATTIIASDKTGTLTLNEMTARKIVSLNFEKEIYGTGYSFEKKQDLNNIEFFKILDICENCNDSIVEINKFIGDPTEIALKVLTRKSGRVKDYELINEIPFSSDRKMMSTIHKVDNNLEMFSKGAFQEIIKKSTKILDNGKIRKITQKDIDYFFSFEEKYSKDALRVLGFAYRQIDNKNDLFENNLIFLGLVASIDPPRKDVKDALLLSRKAGIITKIITGDNSLTTQAIAREIGFLNPKAVNADILDSLDDKKALELIKKTDIFSRAKPEHKFRIVTLLKKSGEIVSVTGDGVNDAPAIKAADVGIAMGIKGTEATKEVADIVLKDDNFSSIVSAIKEGRRVYDNILLFVKYMLAVNFDILLTVVLLILFNFPIPLLALQILWINMVTDSLPAIALGRRKASKDIMFRKPRDPNKGILHNFTVFIIVALFVKIIGELILFSYGLGLDFSFGINSFDLDVSSYARTFILSGIVIFELFFAFVCNIEGKFDREHLLSNKLLIYSVLLVIALHIIVIYVPFFQNIFRLVPLSFIHWIYLFIFGISSILVIPITNFINGIFKKNSC